MWDCNNATLCPEEFPVWTHVLPVGDDEWVVSVHELLPDEATSPDDLVVETSCYP